MNASESVGPVEILTEEFLERRRNGERPSIDEYCERIPELADVIRNTLEALLLVEDMKPDSKSDSADSYENFARGDRPERIADYRIIREIGRGGMGVVYEAEQESLRRRVALKVLPPGVSSDEKGLARFQREAQAAAALHHTNIVPVFDVGQEGDISYYAMQFIPGQGLDAVYEEIRSLRAGQAPVGVFGDSISQSLWRGGLDADAELRPLKAQPPPDADPNEPLEYLEDEIDEHGLPVASETQETVRAVDGRPVGALPPNDSSGGRSTVRVALDETNVSLPGDDRSSSGDTRHTQYFRSIARIGRQIADAIGYAHSRGTVHRDIKPANLLLDTNGVVWVADFGLAKTEDAALTHTGDILGTLRYMSPERFQSVCDHRGDIYALGVTLYELLSLQPAFQSADRLELIDKIAKHEPVPLRALDPHIPRDLETIVAKAMAKEPEKRYQTAGELAEDLRRFLCGEPIVARRVGMLERTIKWTRRHPAVAVAVLFFVLGSFGVAWKWKEANDANRSLTVSEQVAKDERDESQRREARNQFRMAIEQCEQGHVVDGVARLLASLKTFPRNSPGFKSFDRTVRTNLASWTQRIHQRQEVFDHPDEVNEAAFSPNGQLLATACRDGCVRIFQQTADGRSFSIRPVQTLRRPDDVPNRSVVRGLYCVAFSADGRFIAAGTWNGAVIWNIENLRMPRVFKKLIGHWEVVHSVDFSPDGELLLTGGRDRTVRLWKIPTSEQIGEPLLHNERVAQVRFSPSGNTFLTATGWVDKPVVDGHVQLWDTATRVPLWKSPLQFKGSVESVAFHPDGKSFLTAGTDGYVRVWELPSLKLLSRPLRHTDAVKSAQYLPDGRSIVTGCADGSIRVLDWPSGGRLGSIIHQQSASLSVAVSPDGRRIVSATSANSAHLYRIARSRSGPVDGHRRSVFTRFSAHAGIRTRKGLSHDRSFALSTGSRRQNGVARLTDVRSGAPIGMPLFHDVDTLRVLEISPDSKLAATGGYNFGYVNGAVSIWNARTGKRLFPPLVHNNYVSALAFSPDGGTLAAGDYQGLVKFWDTKSGRSNPLETRPHQQIIRSLAFSPDGGRLAVGTTGQRTGKSLLYVWNLAARHEQPEFVEHSSRITHVEFSPDGRTLLSAGSKVHLWNAATLRPIGTPLAQTQGFGDASFHPSRPLVAVGSGDGAIRLWNTSTGKALAAIVRSSSVKSLEFGPQGDRLLAGYADGSARLLRLTTTGGVLRLEPTSAPVNQGASITSVCVSADCKEFITLADDESVRVWPIVEPVTADLETLSLELEVLTGRAMNSDNEVLPLTVDQWRQRREEWIGTRRGREMSIGIQLDNTEWHRRCASDAERHDDWFAARWHLDKLAPKNLKSLPNLLRRARFHAQQRDLAQAGAEYERAISLTSKPNRLSSQLSWYSNGYHDSRIRENWQVARWYLDRLIALESKNPRWYEYRARIHGELGQTEGQDSDLIKAAQLTANPLRFWETRAYKVARKGEWKWAEMYCLKAVAIDPRPIGARYLLALLYLRSGNLDSYRELCRRLVDAWSDIAKNSADDAGQSERTRQFLQLVGICASGPCRVEDAQTLLKHLESNSEQLIKFLVQMQLESSAKKQIAIMAMRRNEPLTKQQLDSMTKRLIQSVTQQQLAMMERSQRHALRGPSGAIRFRAGRYAEAVEQFTGLINAENSQSADHTVDCLLLAMAHRRMNNGGQARHWLKRATTLAQARPRTFGEKLRIIVLKSEAERSILRANPQRNVSDSINKNANQHP